MQNHKSPLITIVTVTLNCAHTLKSTIDSIKIIKDSDYGVEYIIIDGGSTDGTLDIILSNSNVIDKHISEKDSGVYSAMNKGIRIAKGNFLIFLNGDDQFIPKNFLKSLNLLNNNSVDVFSFSCLTSDSKNNSFKLTPSLWKIFFYNSIPHPSTFIKYSVIKKYLYREDLRIASDYYLFLNLIIKKYNFKTNKIPIAIHNQGGISSNTLLSSNEVLEVRNSLIGKKLTYFLDLIRKILT